LQNCRPGPDPVVPYAEKVERAYGGGNGNDADYPNAVKHCTWNCEMARRTGDIIVAQEFGDAHECKSTEEVRQDPNSQMDLHNNEVGRNLAIDSKQGCGAACATSKDTYWLKGPGAKQQPPP
jgi:hypothetical protein